MSLAETITQVKDEISQKKPGWSRIEPSTNTSSLKDVMSEQLAIDLHEKECKVYNEFVNSKLSPNSDISKPSSSIEVSEISENIDNLVLVDPEQNEQIHNDFLIAQLLQLECDKEFDEILKGQENVKNRNSKVSISYDKFRSVHPVNDKDEKEKNAETHQGDLNSDNESEDGNNKYLNIDIKYLFVTLNILLF